MWTRLAVGEVDAQGFTYAGPRDADQLNLADVLVVDEAGMLDQEIVEYDPALLVGLGGDGVGE